MSILPSENLSEKLEEFLKAGNEERKSKMDELMELMRKSREKREVGNKGNIEDCPDDVEDCSDILSPCCQVPVKTIFDTLPLKVECEKCKRQYLMGELIRNLLKK